MKNYISYFLLSFLFSFNYLTTNKAHAQLTASTTIVYTGFQSCGGCTVCGADYYCFNTVSSWCGNTVACDTKTFTDPVPPGNIVTSVTVNYFSAECSGGSLAVTINGNAVPTVNEASSGCLCDNNPCAQSASSSANFPCGLPGYINGGTNSLQLCTGASVCINRLILVFTYAPANQATPANQPTAILGQTSVCPGVTQTFSCASISNAATYDWTVPSGWSINSGQGTNIITATPGSAGNICVSAQNLCGNSAYTCLNVNVLSNSNAPTSINASTNPICSGSSINLSLSGGNLGSGASWAWYSGSCGGTPIGTGNSINVTPGSTTTYFVRAEGSCNNTSCASLSCVVNAVPTANAGNPAVLNCISPSLTLSGSGGGSYSWSGPGIVSGGNSSSPTINQPGTYSLVVTNAGCNSPVATVLISQNISYPSVTSSVSNILDCINTSATINANTSASPVSYSWSGPSIINGANSASPSVNQPGTYNYIVTNTSNGCSTSGSQSVSQNIATPIVSATANGSISCSNTNVLISASSNINSVSYNWSGPSITSGANTPNANVNTGGNYQCVITNTTNGCQAIASVVVPSNGTIVTPTLNISNILTCVINSTSITAIPTGTNYSYNWTGTGIVGSANNSLLNVNSIGNYTLNLLDAINGCTTSAVATVSANTTAPNLSITASNTIITCAINSCSINASTNINNAPTWSTPFGTSNNPFTTNTPGTYTASVTDTVNGCVSSSVINIALDTITPNLNVSNNVIIPCVNPTVTINASSNNANSLNYLWYGPGILTGINTASPTVNQTGVYSVTITNTNNGCLNTATLSVGQATIDALFTADPTFGYAPPLTVNFTDASSAAINYYWNFGDGNSSSLQNPVNIFNTTGTYTVNLIINAGICIDSTSAIIIIENGLTLEIPNVFTPNNDNANDVFTIKSHGVKEISLQIFNRWGEKIYDFTGPKAAWDGFNNQGAPMAEGTYFFFVKATGFDKKEIKQNGHLTLLR